MSEDWVVSQLKSGMNLFGVFGLLGIILYTVFIHGGIHPTDWVIIGLFAGYFLVTAWSMLATMLIFSVVVGGLVAAFPFLAPFAFVLMIILFFMRIQYIFKNWRPIFAGLALYGFVYMFYQNPRILFLLHAPFRDVLYTKHSPLLAQYVTACIQNFVFWLNISWPAVVLQIVLCWLYRRGYSASSAMAIMGSIPLVILAMLLPFLKVIGADAVFDTHTGAMGAHDGMAQDPYVRAPGYHQVHGYDRVEPNGQVQHVDPYIRSNPDGILENNLSYHGEHGQQGEAIEGSEGNVFLRGARIPFVMSWEFAKRNGPTGLLLRGRDLLAILELGLLLAAVFSLLYTSYYFVLRGV